MMPEKMPDSGVIRTVKERLVLEALKALGVVIVPRSFFDFHKQFRLFSEIYGGK